MRRRAGRLVRPRRRAATRSAWSDHLDRIAVDGGTSEQRTVFATAL
ncbi:MAG: hypothetical protein ACFCVK_13870 [Acidimicrobiales bacterium]